MKFPYTAFLAVNGFYMLLLPYYAPLSRNACFFQGSYQGRSTVSCSAQHGNEVLEVETDNVKPKLHSFRNEEMKSQERRGDSPTSSSETIRDKAPMRLMRGADCSDAEALQSSESQRVVLTPRACIA